MQTYKNHEGYRDPTAGRAVRNAAKGYHRKRRTLVLMYPLREARGFTETVRALKRMWE